MEGEKSVNFGQVISEKLTESLSNINLVDTLQKIAASQGDDPESQEVKKKLEQVLEKYNSMSDDERETFQNKIKETLTSRLSSRLQDQFSGLEDTLKEAIAYRLIYILIGAIIFLIVLVFFGYKLYKAIKDKEVKKQEKKKAKMMKKKK